MDHSAGGGRFRPIRPIAVYSAREASQSSGVVSGQPSKREIGNPRLTTFRSTARSRPRCSDLFELSADAGASGGFGSTRPRASSSSAGPASARVAGESFEAAMKRATRSQVGTKYWDTFGCGVGRYGYSPCPSEYKPEAMNNLPFATLSSVDNRTYRLELPSGSSGAVGFKPWEEPS